uniref:RNase H type-1 domain-containing protein n=1 Tax=Cajanus cajan TaxID=3821 RepID=A0A151QQ23_CAJCA|nr:hypothetical protein KK1_046923 [Cajanus cajan]
MAELTPTSAEEQQVWTLHVDGSSNSKGGGAGIILEGPNKGTLEKSLKFGFKVTNNQAEYEALLAGLRLAHDLGVQRSFKDFLRELRIKHLPTSVEHPQTNGQAKVANKVIQELKKRLGSAKGQWVDELPSILWAYHCTPQSTTQETPYRLTFGADAMILVEVGEMSHRHRVFDNEQNAQEVTVNLDLIDELREEARIHEEACKIWASRRYNTRIRPRSFRVGDLVW